jgi:hypothetical protein
MFGDTLRNIRPGRLALSALFVPLVFLMPACWFLNSGRQLRTYANMQVISDEIQQHIEGRLKRSGTCPEEGELKEVIARTAGGSDAWGQELKFYLRDTPGSCDWVLVSAGSDGALERELTAYFGVEPADVHNAPARDIVFRNGRAVTAAGK